MFLASVAVDFVRVGDAQALLRGQLLEGLHAALAVVPWGWNSETWLRLDSWCFSYSHFPQHNLHYLLLCIDHAPQQLFAASCLGWAPRLWSTDNQRQTGCWLQSSTVLVWLRIFLIKSRSCSGSKSTASAWTTVFEMLMIYIYFFKYSFSAWKVDYTENPITCVCRSTSLNARVIRGFETRDNICHVTASMWQL